MKSVVSDDSSQSKTEINEFAHENDASDASSRRRQWKNTETFHCFRNAHCNGDESEEDLDRFAGNSFDDAGYSTEEGKVYNLSESVQSTATLRNTEQIKRPTSSMKLTLAKNLLSVGKSFSTDSLTNSTTETIKSDKAELNVPSSGPQINVGIDSPVSEFEVSCHQSFPKLMNKSVSEEVLNNMNENMQTLSVNNHDELDNLSSSSTSSLVILSKSKRVNAISSAQTNNSELNEPLLSPEELGSNDAFLLFLCLTMLFEDREKIINTKMDRNDIQMYFDNMVRKHNVRNVLDDARNLFHTYLSQWHQECLHK